MSRSTPAWRNGAVAVISTLLLAGCGASTNVTTLPPTATVAVGGIATPTDVPPSAVPSPTIVPTAMPTAPATPTASAVAVPVAPSATTVPAATATVVPKAPPTATPTPAPTVDTAAAARGKAIYLSSVGCNVCHQIDGLSTGDQGPNLTHIASRPYDSMPNDAAFLRRWIANPQAIKPGTLMPNLGLSTAQINDLVVYLETLN